MKRVPGLCLWLLAPGLALAADPQGPVATGAPTPPVLSAGLEPAPTVSDPEPPQSAAPMTTEEKIEAWRRSGERKAERQAAREPAPQDRRVHGEVSGWIGSDGVRGGSVVIGGPLGRNGSATVAVSKSQGPHFDEPSPIHPRFVEP
jgi:hypothetical protein